MQSNNDIDERIRAVAGRPLSATDRSAEQAAGRPIVYLMRGLPSCGKSTTARRIAGADGIVIETDAYFQGEKPGPEHYSFAPDRLETARQWTLDAFRDALAKRISPIVIDRGNGRNPESKIYAQLADQAGYKIALCEPESPWWNEIRVLMRYRPATDPVLDAWADELSRISRSTHRVSSRTIRRWMDHWVDDLAVEQILNC
ncbi:hypothetical protein EC9_02980 [Rosistilla ulvae]|uniref:Zeta toxin n=1 Tax=Rosistilla ulvae TaxID=1930277 RepID=A0A517LU62_9BACT|nr:AAA family ATPase [Rosistilla ulvae]QDS86139.1 hypothetical protein EC9_02980 [Rosistilla ulvae]